MEGLCKVSFWFPLFHSILTTSSHLHIASKIFCIQINGKETVPSEESIICTKKSEMPDSDVGKMFANAKRNIMHINKHRLLAMEEANRLKMENEALLEKLDQLETEMKTTLIELQGKNSVQASSLSLSELLLHIDSMVLSGLLSKGEASKLRKKWMESKVAIHDALGDIHHKTDEQLLSDLRQFQRKSRGFPCTLCIYVLRWSRLHHMGPWQHM